MHRSKIEATQVMQLATIGASNRPWVCSVYFVLHDGCFYWLSLPQRRHSQDIAKTNRVALAIAIKQDIPVMGLQVEGVAEKITDYNEAAAVIDRYTAKYDQGRTFMERFSVGKNQHALYRCTPDRAMLFDETTKTDQTYYEITTELK